MLLDKEIEMSWNTQNRSWYENKGYVFTKYRGKFIIKQYDLTPKSNKKIEYKCDYCGEIHIRAFCDYTVAQEESPVKKDACKKCRIKKNKEYYLLVYGVEHQSQVKEIKDKISNSQKMDFNIINKEFENHNFKLITKKEDYKNAKQKLEYTCNEHPEEGIQHINYDNLKQGDIGCKGCLLNKNIEKAVEYYSKICNERDMKLINIERDENRKYVIYYICNKHKSEGVNHISASNLMSGQGCRFCGITTRALQKRVSLDKVNKVFKYKGYVIINDLNEVYQGNTSVINYICNKHEYLGVQQTNYANVSTATTCKECIKDLIRGENHYLWKGGISPLHNYIRDKISEWKNQSLKYFDYKCLFTDEHKHIVIHHLFAFNMILDTALKILNLDVRDKVNKYSKQELDNILLTVNKLHEKYGLGIVLCKDIHILFHKEYGTGGNTKEQFVEFIKRYYSGEFDNDLIEEFKSKNSHRGYEEAMKMASFYYA